MAFKRSTAQGTPDEVRGYVAPGSVGRSSVVRSRLEMLGSGGGTPPAQDVIDHASGHGASAPAAPDRSSLHRVDGPTDRFKGTYLRQASNLADLGLPLPRTRLRRLKRLIIRMCWVFLHRQVAYNHEVVKELDRAADELTRVGAEARATRSETMAELDKRLQRIEVHLLGRQHDDVAALWDAIGSAREELTRFGRLLTTERAHAPGLEGTPDASRSAHELSTSDLSARQTRSKRLTRPTLSVCCLSESAGPGLVALLGQLRPIADEIFVAVDSRADSSSISQLAHVAEKVARYEFAPPFERALAWAHQQCSGDWVFRIDSDEVASPSLIATVPEIIRARDVVRYHFPRRWLFPDIRSWLDEYPWSPDYQARLVRNDPASLWFEGLVHSNVGGDQPAGYLESPLYHLVCATSTEDDRAARVARYASMSGSADLSRLDRAYYLPEQHADSQPRAVPQEDLEVIVQVVEADAWAAGAQQPFPVTIPAAGRAEIDSYWDRRPVEPDTHRAALELIEADTRMRCGQQRELHLRVTNLSSETWPGGSQRHPLIRVAYRWFERDGAVVDPDGRRSFLPAALRPGRSCLVPVTVVAPRQSGRFVLEIDLVHEGVRWFGCPALADVEISENRSRLEEAPTCTPSQ